jgi:hypothetical protein
MPAMPVQGTIEPLLAKNSFYALDLNPIQECHLRIWAWYLMWKGYPLEIANCHQ